MPLVRSQAATKLPLGARKVTLIYAAVLAVLAGCAAPNQYEEGQRQVGAGQVAPGLARMRDAMQREPDNLRYRLEYVNQVREQTLAGTARAEALRDAGDIDSARASFRAVLQADPTSERARRGLTELDMDARHREKIVDAQAKAATGKLDQARQRLQEVLDENPRNIDALLRLQKINTELENQRHAREAVTAAQSVMKKPVSFQFRDANLRMVFEALSRTTGLNVIFDKDVRADLKTTIFVHDGSVEDTVNLILLQNQLERKILNANTMFIYPATAAKQKEYQELKVRTFRISNGDAKYILSVLKTVLKVKDALVDERTNTLVLRDTPDALDVAAKVIAAHDLADAEVMLEVEVLEVSRDRLTDLGMKWPDAATITTPSLADGSLTLGALGHIRGSQLLVSPLSLGVNLKLQDTTANILASPRIRVRDREKAKILIGDKVPIIINSVTPIQTGSAVVTGSIQYIDVGIKLEVEPHVYVENDVGIKLSLEVSNIVREIQGPSGSLAYQIGTRSATTSLRLRDGETQILGGLISDSDRNTAAKVPGLGQLPVLGRLFSDHSGDHAKNEIVLSITPRIVRAQGVADEAARDIWSGTDGALRATQLRLDPISSVSTAVPSAPAVAGRPAAPAPGEGASAQPPGLAAPGPSPAPADAQAGAPAGPPVRRPEAVPPATVKGIETSMPTAMFASEAAALPSAPTPGAPASALAAPAPVVREAAPREPAAGTNGPLAVPGPVPTGVVPAAPVAAKAQPDLGDDSAAPSRSAATAAVPVPPVPVNDDPGALPRLSWSRVDAARAGEPLKITLNATGFDATRSVPLFIRYDPRVLAYVGGTPGPVSAHVGISAIEAENNDAAGRLNILLRAASGQQFSGAGALMTLEFLPKAAARQTQLQVHAARTGPTGIARPGSVSQQQTLSFAVGS